MILVIKNVKNRCRLSPFVIGRFLCHPPSTMTDHLSSHHRCVPNSKKTVTCLGFERISTDYSSFTGNICNGNDSLQLKASCTRVIWNSFYHFITWHSQYCVIIWNSYHRVITSICTQYLCEFLGQLLTILHWQHLCRGIKSVTYSYHVRLKQTNYSDITLLFRMGGL